MMLADYQLSVDDGKFVDIADASNSDLDLAERALRSPRARFRGTDEGDARARGLERIAIERIIRAKGWR